MEGAALRFEWDPDKARRNLADHRVAFEDAIHVWNDPLHALMLESIRSHEERWLAIGMAGSQTLVVVHTYPDPNDDQTIRIISARLATRQEKRRYGEGDL